MDINCCNKFINKKISIDGWIENKRCFDKIIFILLKDNTGNIQLTIKKDIFIDFNKIKNIPIESCINVKGKIILKNNNKNYEIIVNKINIINISNKIPIKKNNKLSELINLKYRYLYLRNYKTSNFLFIRSNVIWYINFFMRKNNFIYIETPILSKPSTIEGANNFIVNSKFKNKFYSLSQSPQIFKQILMISGFKKYYQIAKCFRNEDSRTDRQPEFTQIDIEMSFVNENDIINISNKLIKFLFKKILNIKINDIPILTYKESIYKFGTDKPDLRNNIFIHNLINLLIDNCIIVNDINKFIYMIYLNKYIDLNIINKYIKDFNLNIIIFNKKDIKNILSKIDIFSKIFNKVYKFVLDYEKNYKYIIFFISSYDCIEIVGKFINDISYLFNLIDKNKFSLIWIKDFPMFKKNKNSNIECFHHPFTSFKYNFNKNDIHKNIFSIISNSYDLIINGYEVASGSVRIDNEKDQRFVFDILNISKNIQDNNFKFFLESLKYGTPNHAGIAFGLDRLIMLLTKSKNIKDVIAFPKSTSSYDFMTDCPIKI